MERILQYINSSTQKATQKGCNHTPLYVYKNCLSVTYCGEKCQIKHWLAQHQYDCIGIGAKRAREDLELVDISRLKDLWGIISPWLNAEDLKNLRLADAQIEKDIRLAFFSRFIVRLETPLFGIRPELASFITKVDDSESGGRLSLQLYRYQKIKRLKTLQIFTKGYIEWDRIFQIYSLEDLEITFSKISRLPNGISSLVNLTTLNLRGNELQYLPESISDCLNLQRLVIAQNEIHNLPLGITRLTNLQKIDLWHNVLEKIPENIGNLLNLESLTLGLNNLSALPNSICKLSQLRTFTADYNNLETIHECFGELVYLELCDFSDNRITNIPKSLYYLQNLKKLYLNSNFLTKNTKDQLQAIYTDKVIV